MIACRYGIQDCAKVLLDHLNALKVTDFGRDELGNSVFMLCCASGLSGIVLELKSSSTDYE
jgi:hypothetical protein